MDHLVLFLLQLLVLKDIILMEQCVFQLFLVFVLKGIFKEELNVSDKQKYHALEMQDGMELHV
jgi:hypothetical protein